ncbi:MAG TPA: type II secretion system F family protein [Patescibacteria group bacterium]|nr:type II secretion system F family protein [Patescibacteria group bacterium]
MSKQFVYRVRDHSGRQIQGVVTANEEKAAAAFLCAQGYYVTYLREQRSRNGWRRIFLRGAGVNAKEQALFCRQMVIMLEAGVPLTGCLQVLSQQENPGRMNPALEQVLRQVRSGDALSQAMKALPHYFPLLMVSMVAVGENSGALQAVLQRLAIQYEKEHRFRERIKSALIYPAITALMAIFCVLFIMAVVLPAFEQIFQGTGATLPLLTRILISAGRFVQEHGAGLVTLAMAAAGTVFFFLQKPAVQERVADGLLRLPVVGPFWRKLLLARFSWSLGLLLQSGVPILAALEMVEHLIAVPAFIKALENSGKAIRRGAGLAEPLKKSGLFPGMVVKLIAVGEETGSLVKVLNQIAQYYEEEVDEFARRINSLTEPALICVLGLVVGTIVLAVMLPLLDMTTLFSM